MPRETIQDQWPEEATFCWGCGKNNEHGLQLKSYLEGDETVASWTPEEHHLAFPGILNGGIIATLIDCHATGTANALAHRKEGRDDHTMHVTASLNIKYLRPTPLGRPLTLRARVEAVSGRRMTVSCSLSSDGVECAIGRVETASVDVKRFLRTE